MENTATNWTLLSKSFQLCHEIMLDLIFDLESARNIDLILMSF